MPRLMLILAVAALSLLTIGLSPVSTASEQPGGGTPVRGGTLTVALVTDAQNLDPLRLQDTSSSVVLALVADSLFELDGEGNVVGRLVERSEQPEPNLYALTLRPGLTFHDGTALDAAAVKFNLERHRQDPSSVRYADVKDIVAIDTPDPLTVRVLLSAPSALFTGKLTGGAGTILSPAAVERLGDDLRSNLSGAGSGPFRFTSWERGSRIVLDRNPSYWRSDAIGVRLPYLDRVVLMPIPDDNVRLAALLTGQVEALIGNPPFSILPTLRQASGLVVEERPGVGFSFIALNTRSGPLADPGVRRALSLALDRDQIVQEVYAGVGIATDTPMPPAIGWAQPEEHPYLPSDLTRARAELEAAGFGDGFSFTLEVQDMSAFLRLAVLWQEQLHQIGVTMAIRSEPFATLITNGNEGRFEALALGWSGGNDPDDNLYTLYRSNAAFNFTGYTNPVLDALLDQGRATSDRAERAAIYRQAQQIIFEDQPYLIVYSGPQLIVHNQTVHDFPRSYNGYWGVRDFDRVWKATR